MPARPVPTWRALAHPPRLLGWRAGLAVLDLLKGELLEKAVQLGEKVRDRLLKLQERYEIIGDVRGLGPMMGMELVKDRENKEPAGDEAGGLVKHCYEKGLIVLRCGPYHNVIRTLMPLVITDQQLERGLSIMEEGLLSLTK